MYQLYLLFFMHLYHKKKMYDSAALYLGRIIVIHTAPSKKHINMKD